MRRILQWCTRPNALRASILIRILVGSVFLSEGIQKFLFPATLGAGRFVKIGIPAAYFMAPFVGAVEVVFGFALLLGLLTRLSSIPLLIVILVAIATTKLVAFPRVGFWAVAHDGRADYSMLMGLLFLLLAGSSPFSLDSLIARAINKNRSTPQRN
ncbi:MAG: DoxX family protein [Acidobacteriaceae bacterium]|nr:DoxX family protein [Acidobacteriaceae bacterium]